jgi:hypothetical protein
VFDNLGRWGPGTTLAWDGRSRRRWNGARRCSASTWPACAKRPRRSSRTSVPMAPGSGASCSWNANSGPRPTADGGAATSTVDGSQPPTHRPQRAGERARSIHQDRILIRVLHPGLFPQDPTSDLHERRTVADRREPARLRRHVDQTWTKPHAADRIVAHADGFGACHTAASAGGCAPPVHDSRRGTTSSSIQAMAWEPTLNGEGGAMPWSPMRRTHGWRRR